MICLKTRLGEIHIVNWTTYRGIHYTLCARIFSNKDSVETFSANNVFPDMCPNCYNWQNNYDLESANENARNIKPTQILSTSISVYHGVQKGWGNTKDLFEDTIRRYWPKEAKMRRKFPQKEVSRTKKHKTYGQSPKRK